MPRVSAGVSEGVGGPAGEKRYAGFLFRSSRRIAIVVSHRAPRRDLATIRARSVAGRKSVELFSRGTVSFSCPLRTGPWTRVGAPTDRWRERRSAKGVGADQWLDNGVKLGERRGESTVMPGDRLRETGWA